MQILSEDKTVRSDTKHDLNVLTLNFYQRKLKRKSN